MNKVKKFFQKYGQAVLWIKKLLPKCRQAALCVTKFFQKYGQGILWTVFIILFVSLISVMFFNCAESLFGNLLGTSESKQETLKFIGFAMGGVLAALGAMAVNRRADAQIKNNELIEIEHIGERFKAAVDHLIKKETQLAAYYEFYSWAKKHEEPRKNIFNVLCGQLREITNSEDYKTKYPDNPSENIQTLLDILFKYKGENVFDKLLANLQRTHLVGANLNKANLQGANLRSANLQNATFLEANLQGANLSFAKNMTSEMIEKAIIDEKTKLPEGVTHPSRKKTP